MTPQKPQKLFNLIKIGSLWAWKNLRGYGRKLHAKFWPWGTPWDLIYDHFWVLCQHSNFQYWIFWSIWRSMGPRRYLIFFLMKFPIEWRQNHVWGCICDPSYDHIYKNIHFCKGWIGWQPRLKRASKTMSNGIFKVPNAWILVDFMRVLW